MCSYDTLLHVLTLRGVGRMVSLGFREIMKKKRIVVYLNASDHARLAKILGNFTVLTESQLSAELLAASFAALEKEECRVSFPIKFKVEK